VKRFIAFIVTLLLLPALFASAAAAAEEVVLTADVPAKHAVTLDVGEGGAVSVGGTVYTGSGQVDIDRHTEAQYTLKPDDGYALERVLYNGEDVSAQVNRGVFTAPPIVAEASLQVSFRKAPAAQTPAAATPAPASSQPKTGDASAPGLWLAAALLCGGGLCAVIPARKRCR